MIGDFDRSDAVLCLQIENGWSYVVLKFATRLLKASIFAYL